MLRSIFLAFLLFLTPGVSADDDQFDAYWMSGKAELVSYKLTQSRYGKEREGHAVAVWVTEDMDPIKQVKLDDPQNTPPAERVKVLKLNLIRRFTTGLYDYSLMRSTFQPIDLKRYSYPLKTTFTAQDWCGQVMWQLNTRKNDFELVELSYFESEGDSRRRLPAAFSEDQVWTQIRIDPESLPTGDLKAYPAASYIRLEHKEYREVQAFATLDVNERANEIVYSLGFPVLKRSVTWHVSGRFPHRLLRWSEQFVNAAGEEVETVASQKEVLHTDYWNKSDEQFSGLRSAFKVPSFELQ